ncbi:MAG: carbon-nitrogen hydrolase family protein [Actinomycetota bacterium]|nr:carbon-nitrogen hydrolase family protein [Actinomycetota bacterium]
MRDELTVGLAQWLPEPGAPDRNLSAALELVEHLAADGCDLITLPELWPCGYDPETLPADVADAAEPLDGPRTKLLAEAAGDLGVWLAAGSVPELDDGHVLNTSLLFSREGDLVGTHRKVHLYGPAERQGFTAGDRLTTVATDELGVVGLCVCFDGDFPEVGRSMAALGARLVISPSAYPAADATWWDRLYPATAMLNAQWWVMTNQAGTNGDFTLLGASKVVSPLGDTVAEAPRAANGETAEPATLVTRIAFKGELERAEQELAELREGRRPEVYDTEGAT